jgi:hypothetical protein
LIFRLGPDTTASAEAFNQPAVACREDAKPMLANIFRGKEAVDF